MEKNIILVNMKSGSVLNVDQMNDIENFEIFFPTTITLNQALDILVSKVKQS